MSANIITYTNNCKKVVIRNGNLYDDNAAESTPDYPDEHRYYDERLTCGCGLQSASVEMRNTEDGYMEMCPDCYNKYQARKMAEYAEDDAIIVEATKPIIKKVVKKPMPSEDMGVFHYHTVPNPTMPWSELLPTIGELEKCYDINGKEMELFTVSYGDAAKYEDGVNEYVYLGQFSSICVNTQLARSQACNNLMYTHHNSSDCRKCGHKNKIVNNRPEGLRNNWHRYCDDYIKAYDQLEIDVQYYTLDIEPILGSSGLLKFIKEHLEYKNYAERYSASKLRYSTPPEGIELRKKIETAIGKMFAWNDFRLVCEYYCRILTQNPTEFDFLL
jgi:hypothetical protein